jgi:tight adherence protein C
MSTPALVSLGSVVALVVIVLSSPKPARRIGAQTADLQHTQHGTERPGLVRGLVRGLELIGQLTRRLLVLLLEQVSPQSAERVALAEMPTDRTVGLGVLVSTLAASLDMRLLILALAVVFVTRRIGPVLTARRVSAKRSEAVEQSTPVLVDLVRAAVSSGVTPRTLLQSLQLTSRVDGLAPFDDSLRSIQQSLQSGVPFVDALEVFKAEGTAVLGLVAALQASELYGVSLAPSLEALSLDARLTRRRRVEIKARRLPVSLLFPLVVCVLPAFMLLTVVPLLFSGLSSIRW